MWKQVIIHPNLETEKKDYVCKSFELSLHLSRFEQNIEVRKEDGVETNQKEATKTIKPSFLLI